MARARHDATMEGAEAPALPENTAVTALAGRYGLMFGQPDWLADLISRYDLTPPPGG